MELTEEQKQEIKQQFKTRRNRQLCISLPIAALMIAAIIFEDRLNAIPLPVSEQTFGIVFLALVAAVLALSFKNWRCPACDKYLGRSISPKFCAKCGVELQ